MTLGTNSASRETSNSLRNAVRRIVEASWFTSFITLIIIANAITLGAATYDNLPPALHAAFALFDQFVIVVFVLEIMLRFFYRSRGPRVISNRLGIRKYPGALIDSSGSRFWIDMNFL